MKKPNLYITNYNNISTIFKGKSNYLNNLEKRRNDGMRIIKEKKKEIFFEDYFNLNKFKRDYSCFYSDNLQENPIPVKFHISNNFNMHWPTKIEKDFSKNKENFSLKKIKRLNNNNYTSSFPKRKFPVNYNKNSIKRRKKLAYIGKQIIAKSTYK